MLPAVTFRARRRASADGAAMGRASKRNTPLQLGSRFAAPIARFGHGWVLGSGARQFITRAIEPLVGDETALA